MMNIENVMLYSQPSSAEQVGAIVLCILFIVALLVLSGLCFAYGHKSLVKLTYRTIREEQRKEEEEQRRTKAMISDGTKLWLCPICGCWQREPELHLKTSHKISDDMLEFWIEKGKWL